MNKLLLVEDIKELRAGEYDISYNQDTQLKVTGKTIMSNIDKNNCSLDIELASDAEVFLDKVNVITKDMHINIKMNQNSHLVLNWVIINDGNNKVVLDINMLGNNNKAEVHVRVINKNIDDSADVICNGMVCAGTIDNELLEDLKGLLMNDNTIKISPNMNVGTNETMANHLVTIGPLSREELFYLMSRGMSKKQARALMRDSFACSLVNENLKEQIKMEVKDIE
ncbi:MAG: SufD family Fe-S cluster assembly protein, partial [Bacilli bacterium]|nr:SufD family Fe-S cluster assembly protein [Bacilli bacterium]